MRPLGPVNLVVFVVAVLSAVVLFVVARRKGAKVKVRVKLGTVASLGRGTRLGLWSGLGAVAGKDDKGVLATNVPAVERAQAAVLPVSQPPVVERPADEEKVGEVRRFEVPSAFWNWTAFSLDGRRILYCGLSPSTKDKDFENLFVEWDWQSRKELRRVSLPAMALHDAAWSPDRKLLLLSAFRDVKSILAVGCRGCQRTASAGPAGHVLHEGDLLHAVLGGGDAIVLVDTSTGKAVRRFEGADAKDAHRLAVSSDGKLLYTSGIGLASRVWDVDSGKFLREVTRGQKAFSRPSFAPDSRLVLDGGKGDVRLWDVRTGKAAGSFEGLDEFHCAAFGTDGKRLVTSTRSMGRWAAPQLPSPVRTTLATVGRLMQMR